MSVFQRSVITASVFAIIVFAFYGLGGQRYISLATLQSHYVYLLDFCQQHPIISSTIFTLTYTLLVMFSIPVATALTIIGGFLFGFVWGTTMVVLAATMGSCLFLLVVRLSVGQAYELPAHYQYLEKLRSGFNHSAFFNLLILRIMPFIPFFLVNILCALCGTRLRIFFWATLIGVMPSKGIYVWIGSGLGTTLLQAQQLTVGDVVNPVLMLPLLALSLFGLLGLWLKKRYGKTIVNG